jgi:hypothetical protein
MCIVNGEEYIMANEKGKKMPIYIVNGKKLKRMENIVKKIYYG